MSAPLSRRKMLSRVGLAAGAAAGLAAHQTPTEANAADDDSPPTARFGYCLNMSTIRGQELSLVEEIEIAAQVGYQAIEPWIREIQTYVDAGGSLSDLRKRIADFGLTVESAIGFAQWIVDDDVARAKGLEDARRDMDLVAQLGGKRIAAPPAGATKQPGLDLLAAADRYRTLLQIGDEIGVVPQVEIWGSSQSMRRLGEAAFVAIESGHPKACILPDVYHIYKGGSEFTGLSLIEGSAIQVFHMNDYPATPPRDTIGDADRVYPGDGIAPLSEILNRLTSIGSHCMLSLELFNRGYWEQDATTVAHTGLEKMKAAVARAVEA